MSATRHHRARPVSAAPRPDFDPRPASAPAPSGFCDHTPPGTHLHFVRDPGVEGELCEACRVQLGLLDPEDVVDPELRVELGLAQ